MEARSDPLYDPEDQVHKEGSHGIMVRCGNSFRLLL